MQMNLLRTLCVLLLSATALPMHADTKKPEPALDVSKAKGWPSCREYLPKKDQPCRVDFDMARTKDGKLPPQVHKDISVWPGEQGQAVVILNHSSPFAVCSLTTAPGPLGRDISTGVSGLLTLLGTFGALSEGPPAPVAQPEALAKHIPHSIEDREAALEAMLEAFEAAATPVYLSPGQAFKDLQMIHKNLSYSYPDQGTASAALQAISGAAVDFERQATPTPAAAVTAKQIQQQYKELIAAVNQFAADFPQASSVVEGYRTRIATATAGITDLPAALVWQTDAAKPVSALVDFLATLWMPDSPGQFLDKAFSTQILPIAIYPESKVAVTVKCTDAVTGNPLFDSIQFNAFYQVPPTLDISAGVLVSFLKGRQVGVQADPYPATTSTLAVTSRSRVQFIPGTFVEYHPFNFKLPWVHDPAFGGDSATWMSMKAPRHALGYVGSFGLAGGFLVNPNNGTGEAEFFEGLSLGVQRFSILIGNHTGRSQNFIEGYAVGDPVTSTVAPPTTRNWGNGVAIGIAYRIPLR